MNTSFNPIAIVALAVFPSLSQGTESSVPFMHADQVHSQYLIDGLGVTVAVVDTGVDYSDGGLAFDIAPGGLSIVGGVVIHDQGVDPDGGGHGTVVSLIITDPTGVAPLAQVLPIRVTVPGGPASPFDEATAIDYITARRAVNPGLRVVNLALGGSYPVYDCPCDSQGDANVSRAQAIQRALDAGIITFVTTGNDASCGHVTSPGCIGAAVKAVANYDASYGLVRYEDLCDDQAAVPYRVTCFSDIGPACDWVLAAPGYDITVGDYGFRWGTSYACAHCSGVAALMFSKAGCGSLTAYQVRQIMYNTATAVEWAYPYCPLPPQPKHVDALAAVNAVATLACASLGDLDCDGLVSGYDFPRFERCMSGPGSAYAHAFCACTDFPESPPDGDVDLRDLRLFQLNFDGMGSGTCCHADSTCSVTTVYDCLAENGAVYSGHGTTCADTDCVMDRYINVADPLGAYAACGAGLQLADDLTLSATGGGMLTHYELDVYGGGGGTFNVTVQCGLGASGAVAGTFFLPFRK